MPHLGSSEKAKDPRPLHDKGYIQSCIKQLNEFLGEHGFAVAPKSLQCPSNKDFLRIFSFICSFLIPDVEVLDSKFDEEVPRIFKDLGYPFPFSKSSMYTVGAPHTWPQMVVALVWLVDCINVYHIANDDESVAFSDEMDSEETEDGIVFNKLFLSYTSECYNHFMAGDDSFEELDAELLPKLKLLFNVNETQLESLAAEQQNLAKEVERLEREKENEPDRVMALKKSLASIQQDYEKYGIYLAEVESRINHVEQRVSSTQEELEAAILERDAAKQESARLLQIFEKQKFSVADIKRIYHERRELQQTVNSMTEKLEEAERHKWNEEIKFAKIKELIETDCMEFHKMARKLKLMPRTAENAGGLDFEVRLYPETGLPSLLHYRSMISPHLDLLMSQVEDEITKASNLKVGDEELLDQLKICVADKDRDLKRLTEEIRKQDEVMKQIFEETEQEEKELESKLRTLENKNTLLQTEINKEYTEATKEHQAIEQQFQQELSRTTKELKGMLNKLSQSVDMASTSMSQTERYLEEQCAKISKAYEELTKDDPFGLKEIVSCFQQELSTDPQNSDV
ncbi:kinetochore protein NDC80 homolog [Protopterus annectens]|uniref:kinetochore protein NDC80 homolog n=1 Tax=Protopterus annectens TaxID=7888 RepID=UPI001CFC19AF|nr:kinetochore protein NDC80 homolog [Protopterus annectens]